MHILSISGDGIEADDFALFKLNDLPRKSKASQVRVTWLRIRHTGNSITLMFRTSGNSEIDTCRTKLLFGEIKKVITLEHF